MIICPHCKTENPDDASFCIDCRKKLTQQVALGMVPTPLPDDLRPKQAPAGANLDLEPGAVFAGRYTIVERIGQGGMGVVYRATETLGSREREIALKLIRTDLLVDDKAIDRLVSEGVLTQDIRHPNVVGVYNVGVDNDRPFVAMEYIDGVSLREWIMRQMNAQKETSLATVATLLRNILDGLAAAHQMGVVHRDLKPENVILTGEATPDFAPLKILDFGIARAPGTRNAMTGTGMGTQNYMAPEQITNPDSARPSADLYSLSVMFYELLMGVLPKGHWQPPSGGRGDVPEAVDILIQDGLNNFPMKRPQDTGVYRSRLDAAVAGLVPDKTDEPVRPVPPPPPSPPPSPPPPPSQGWSTGKKWAVGAGAAVVALIGLDMSIPDPVPPGNQGIRTVETPLTQQTGQQRQALYTDTTGTWDGTNGVYLDVVTQPDGSFMGDGVWVGGYDIDVNGSLATGVVNMAYPNGQGFTGKLTGLADWCHVRIDAVYPDGSSAGGTGFHIDHQPGADCPALE